METKTISVPSISCGHCTNTIESEVGELAGVVSVSAEIDSKQVTIQYQAPTNWAEISETLEEIGHPAA